MADPKKDSKSSRGKEGTAFGFGEWKDYEAPRKLVGLSTTLSLALALALSRKSLAPLQLSKPRMLRPCTLAPALAATHQRQRMLAGSGSLHLPRIGTGSARHFSNDTSPGASKDFGFDIEAWWKDIEARWNDIEARGKDIEARAFRVPADDEAEDYGAEDDGPCILYPPDKDYGAEDDGPCIRYPTYKPKLKEYNHPVDYTDPNNRYWEDPEFQEGSKNQGRVSKKRFICHACPAASKVFDIEARWKDIEARWKDCEARWKDIEARWKDCETRWNEAVADKALYPIYKPKLKEYNHPLDDNDPNNRYWEDPKFLENPTPLSDCWSEEGSKNLGGVSKKRVSKKRSICCVCSGERTNPNLGKMCPSDCVGRMS